MGQGMPTSLEERLEQQQVQQEPMSYAVELEQQGCMACKVEMSTPSIGKMAAAAEDDDDELCPQPDPMPEFGGHG